MPAMQDRRPESSRNPTVLTRSSSPPSTEHVLVRAACPSATPTTRNMAACDSGASMLCVSIGTLSQLFPDNPNLLLRNVARTVTSPVAVSSERATLACPVYPLSMLPPKGGQSQNHPLSRPAG